MREIKFRAWDGERMHPVEQWQNKSWVAVPIPTNDGNGGVDWHLEQRKIDDIQLMQYTGLKDKNNKEIFEGDVVKWFSNRVEKAIVKFSNGIFQLKIQEPENDDYYMDILHNWTSTIEVIGNLYENPELLDK